jgi:hypothetical protein
MIHRFYFFIGRNTCFQIDLYILDPLQSAQRPGNRHNAMLTTHAFYCDTFHVSPPDQNLISLKITVFAAMASFKYSLLYHA